MTEMRTVYGGYAAQRQIDGELVEEDGIWATPEAHRAMREARRRQLPKPDDDDKGDPG